MIEFVGFGALATGVLYAQHRYHARKNTQQYIEKVFRNVGIAMPDRDKHGNTTSVKFPTYKGSRVHDWGVAYMYQLPVGLTYKMLTESKPVENILENMFNRDVLIKNETHNFISINVYKDRLPVNVPYEMEWLEKCKHYKVVIGVDHHGLIFHDFNRIPHMIIGGMTRYGKSVVMKLLITQLLLRQQGVKFHLFDLKGGLAFNRFKKLPQVHSVARNVDESLKKLKSLRNQIIKRQKYFELKGYEDIGEAIKAGECFDRDIIVIDEASVLAPQSKSDQERNECKAVLEFIAQVAGGLGYNLIMCSQYPTGDILPRQVKQNSDARLSFRLPTSTASNVILDESGAEDIGFGMQGRAIYRTDQKRMLQVPLLSNERIDELLAPLKEEREYADEQPDMSGEGNEDSSEFSPFGPGNAITAPAHS
jgi:DNA segregation ATPase FtsK/SpoIIIE, S-DNA-T family